MFKRKNRPISPDHPNLPPYWKASALSGRSGERYFYIITLKDFPSFKDMNDGKSEKLFTLYCNNRAVRNGI